MNVLTRTQPGGEKSLPAELRSRFQGTRFFGMERLHRNAEVVQNRGGGRGEGLGQEPGDFGGEVGTAVPVPPQVYAPDPAYPPPGVAPVDWAKIIQAGSSAMIPILAATNPGTLYQTNPRTGQIQVYSQPVGSTQNLPVGGFGGGGAATYTGPLGTGSIAGVSGTTILMFAGLGLLAFMVMSGRGRG